MDQPLPAPTCCGQEAKWLTPMPNMAYYYCSKCKKEVEATKRQGIFIEDEYTTGVGAFLGRNSVGGGGYGSTSPQPSGGGLSMPQPPLTPPGGMPASVTRHVRLYMLDPNVRAIEAIEQALTSVWGNGGAQDVRLNVASNYFSGLLYELSATNGVQWKMPTLGRVVINTAYGNATVEVVSYLRDCESEIITY